MPRPRGSKTKKRVENDVKPSSCPKCGSTKRRSYDGNANKLVNVVVDGVLYRVIEFKRTQCLECGQCRTDRVLHS